MYPFGAYRFSHYKVFHVNFIAVPNICFLNFVGNSNRKIIVLAESTVLFREIISIDDLQANKCNMAY